MNNIWAIILAAGESKRMKVPKMLLPFDGKPMIEKVILNVKGSDVSDILVVLGSFRDEIIAAIEDLPARYCYNEHYRDGMLSSVKCGFRNLPEDFDAVLVFPGDQPFIEPGVINKMISAFRQTKTGIIVPVYRKKRGHPVLISSKYRDDVYSLAGNEGLRALSSLHPGDVFEVNIRSQGILKDFNTKEDYLNEINQNK